ncbi:unnamed protein product [Closterium sp. NIES-65]|nr:unnamed protein product [Closterium sp. NIES-65]
MEEVVGKALADWTEVRYLGALGHPNLVQLVGHCKEGPPGALGHPNLTEVRYLGGLAVRLVGYCMEGGEAILCAFPLPSPLPSVQTETEVRYLGALGHLNLVRLVGYCMEGEHLIAYCPNLLSTVSHPSRPKYLGALGHPNLVRLVGYCMEGEHRLLAYELMEYGSLERYLFRRNVTPLPWNIRMKVALHAARGLAYLHEETEAQVIYRDFKASNILVDREFNAKLSDFGLAKDGPVGSDTHVSTRVMGTYGYAAPEYMLTGHLTAKSDVYSFGVVLLEIISGRRAVERNFPPGQQNIVEWSAPFFVDRRMLVKIVDQRLENQFSVKGVVKAARLAYNCLKKDPKERPLMSSYQ